MKMQRVSYRCFYYPRHRNPLGEKDCDAVTLVTGIYIWKREKRDLGFGVFVIFSLIESWPQNPLHASQMMQPLGEKGFEK